MQALIGLNPLFYQSKKQKKAYYIVLRQIKSNQNFW